MQYPDDPEDLSATSAEESGQEDEADANVAGADGVEDKQEEVGLDSDYDVEAGSDADEGNQEEAGSDADEGNQEKAGSDADDDVEAGSDADDDVEAGSDDVDDVEAGAPAAGSEADGDHDAETDEADVRAAGTESGSDDDEAADADEEVDADPAGNRRANLVVAASLLLAAIVTVTATIYAPPPPAVTPSTHGQGLIPTPFSTGDVTFSTIHNFPRGGTAIANDNNKKWNGNNPVSVDLQVGVGPGDHLRARPSALIHRFLSVVFTSFLHMFYFWPQFGLLDLVLLALVWVLMGIVLYHG